MPEQFVESTYEADVVTLTLDRQLHNTMNIEMIEQVNSALLDLPDHRQLEVLVIRGRGDLMALEDAREGIESKLQGRTPEWRSA